MKTWINGSMEKYIIIRHIVGHECLWEFTLWPSTKLSPYWSIEESEVIKKEDALKILKEMRFFLWQFMLTNCHIMPHLDLGIQVLNLISLSVSLILKDVLNAFSSKMLTLVSNFQRNYSMINNAIILLLTLIQHCFGSGQGEGD